MVSPVGILFIFKKPPDKKASVVPVGLKKVLPVAFHSTVREAPMLFVMSMLLEGLT